MPSRPSKADAVFIRGWRRFHRRPGEQNRFNLHSSAKSAEGNTQNQSQKWNQRRLTSAATEIESRSKAGLARLGDGGGAAASGASLEVDDVAGETLQGFTSR